MQIIDLHVDLLSYLAGSPKRSVWDQDSQTALSDLEAGKVAHQVFPIYTDTDIDSVQLGERQFALFSCVQEQINKTYAHLLMPYLAIENASSFCLEKEPLQNGLSRLVLWHQKHPIAYVSLTWNGKNRFGGGVYSPAGLTPDGEKLIELMAKNHIPIDLSHASDQLALDILDFIQGSSIQVIASHSNFRSIHHHPRNLSDDIAKKIARQKGVIGLSLVRHFVGQDTIFQIKDHILHGLFLGLETHLCLGADFFAEKDVKEERKHLKPFFFKGFESPACYPKLAALLQPYFSTQFIEQLFYQNAAQFLKVL